MKFTVGMLDASAVFLKDAKGEPKSSTPTMVRDQPVTHSPTKSPHQKHEYEPHAQELYYHQNHVPTNEVSPSVDNSTDNAYPYDIEYTAEALDLRPQWTGFSNFTSGDVQEWSLDQLYNFDNMQSIEDILGNKKVIQEYDESGNIFAGF